LIFSYFLNNFFNNRPIRKVSTFFASTCEYVSVTFDDSGTTLPEVAEVAKIGFSPFTKEPEAMERKE